MQDMANDPKAVAPCLKKICFQAVRRHFAAVGSEAVLGKLPGGHAPLTLTLPSPIAHNGLTRARAHRDQLVNDAENVRVIVVEASGGDQL